MWTWVTCLYSVISQLRFLWKETTSGRGWHHHMWIHNDLWTQDALYLRKHNESEPEDCGRIPATRVFYERDKEAVGRESYKFTITLNARRVLLEKVHGIWKGSRDARFSWKKIRNEFTVTRNARHILPEKTQGIWEGWYSTHFHWKTHESAVVRNPCHINLKSKWRSGAFYTRKHNDLSGVGGSHM